MPKEKTLKFDPDWFDTHVLVIGPDSETEEAMKKALKKKVKEKFVVDNQKQTVV